MVEPAGIEPATSYLQRTTRSNAVLPEPIRQRCANNYGVRENMAKVTGRWDCTVDGTCSVGGSRIYRSYGRGFEFWANTVRCQLQLLIRPSVLVPVIQSQLECTRKNQRIELLFRNLSGARHQALTIVNPREIAGFSRCKYLDTVAAYHWPSRRHLAETRRVVCRLRNYRLVVQM